MNENFDCTQFISFDYDENPTKQNILLSFKKLGFTLIEKDCIRKVKIDFFKDQIEQCFYELKNDNFIGEFEDWAEENAPPDLIVNFVQTIEEWMHQLQVSHFKLFLTLYAEFNGNTTCYITKSTINNAMNELFKLSRYYYGKQYDNMIIDITL